MEYYFEEIRNKKFIKLGITKRFNNIGSQEYMKKINKIDKESLIKLIKKLISTF